MKNYLVLPVILCSGFLAYSPALHAENSIASAPEAGQGTEKRAGAFRERRGEIMEKIASALELTEAQKARIKPIIEERRSQFAALHKNGSLSREEKVSEFKEILQSTKHQIREILTPAQQKKLDGIIEKLKEHRQEKRK